MALNEFQCSGARWGYSALDSNNPNIHLHIAWREYLEKSHHDFIAHRLSRGSGKRNRIVVFDGGEIIADGDHDSLIQQQWD